MTKVFIASPAFDGKVNVQFAIALADTNLYLTANKVPTQFHISVTGSLLVAERNRILKAFMESDCTHILCVDSDIGWPAEAVGMLLQHNVDFVAGIYPARGLNKTFLFRPAYNENHSIAMNESKTLLKMNFIPAGFMLIKRCVIETMQKKYPELYFEPKNEQFKHESGFAFFNTEIFEGEFWGEDFVFCKRVRDAGFDIWVDPRIPFDHAGIKGALVEVLTDNREKSNAPDVLESKSKIEAIQSTT